MNRWLSISLTLNAALLVLLATAAHWRSGKGRAPGYAYELTNRVIRTGPTQSRPAPAPAKTVTIEVNESFRWSQIESQDYRQFVANLRGIGCPEETVRDIIVADVRELYLRRVQELVDTVQGRFWELMSASDKMKEVVDEKAKQLETMEAERKEMLTELLGHDGVWKTSAEEQSHAEDSEQRKQRLDFLPKEKALRCIAVEQKFFDLRREASSGPGAGQKEMLQRLDVQESQELGQILAPDELAEYKLRDSPFARLRLNTPGFEASPDEIREIARLQAGLRANREPDNSIWQDSTDPRHSILSVPSKDPAAREEQRRELTDLLGAERYAQLERSQDARYQEFYQITDRLELPADVAQQAFGMRASAEEAGRKVRLDQTTTLGEKSEQLQALKAETERSLSALLGTQAWTIYTNRSGAWIGNVGN